MGRLYIVLVFLCFVSCKNGKNIPDVSQIEVDINIERFEQSFFRIDTNNIIAGLQKTREAFPLFYKDFMMGILQLNLNDSSNATHEIVKSFLSSYHTLNDTLQIMYKDMSGIEKQLEENFRFVKHYFPEYKIPGVITFIGTLDAPGIALTNDYIAIGLHQYAGGNFSGYKSMEAQQLYPSYISRRFTPEYIPVNSMKIVSEDLFPDQSTGRPLIEQIIENGKRLFLIDHFMPNTPDSLKTGYTQSQQEWVVENEGLIWNYIIQNENLYSIDPVVIQTYIGESPFTQNMPQASPGNIGQWVGWQIIQKYAENNPEKSVGDIMKTSPRTILDQAKYKPK